MKKNITINMFGQLIAIDEDAYQLLDNYLSSLRQYFRKEESCDEIVDDIERRVCELFNELKETGVQAIAIEHVETIIKQIGNPEEMDGQKNEGNQETASQNNQDPRNNQNSQSNHNNQRVNMSSNIFSGPVKKKYYRDTKDKFIAGVLSGASKYFGGDPLVWRLGFILFVVLWNGVSSWGFFNNMHIFPIFSFPICAYILLAFLAPAAKSPEDRLRMKGIEVNPQNLASELSEEAKAQEQAANSLRNGSDNKGCMSALFSFIGIMAKIFVGLFCLFMFVCFVITITACISLMVSPEGHITSRLIDHDLIYIYGQYPATCILFGISLLLIFFIPGYCAFHSLLSSSGKVQSMSMLQRWVWFIIWITSIVTITLSGISIAGEVAELHKDQIMDEYEYWDDNHRDEEQLDSIDYDSISNDSTSDFTGNSLESGEKNTENQDRKDTVKDNKDVNSSKDIHYNRHGRAGRHGHSQRR